MCEIALFANLAGFSEPFLLGQSLTVQCSFPRPQFYLDFQLCEGLSQDAREVDENLHRDDDDGDVADLELSRYIRHEAREADYVVEGQHEHTLVEVLDASPMSTLVDLVANDDHLSGDLGSHLCELPD